MFISCKKMKSHFYSQLFFHICESILQHIFYKYDVTGVTKSVLYNTVLVRIIAALVIMSEECCENNSSLFILLIFQKNLNLTTNVIRILLLCLLHNTMATITSIFSFKFADK